MTNTRLYATLLFTLLIATTGSAQVRSKTVRKDFCKLSGAWEGSLTYLDYSLGKSYTMPADVVVERIGTTSQFAFANIYPDEPNANSVDTVSISADGKYVNRELIRSRRKLPGGVVEIITEEVGEDGNDHRPATFRHTYTLGPTTYTIRKDVQFTGETAWINRHEYSYKRKSGK